jgi:hypothetical protein
MGAPGRIASQVMLKDWQKIAAARRSGKKDSAAHSRTQPRVPVSAAGPPEQSPFAAEPLETAASPSPAREKD